MNKLGKEVKCRISGFQGVAVWHCTYLQGCDRYGVQPPAGDKGDLPKAHEFDDPDLEVVGDGVTVPPAPEPVKLPPALPPVPRRRPGGPHDHGTGDRRRGQP